MNNFKSCIPCVCIGSGHKWVCERHDIDTQCGATATKTAAQTTENINATNNQHNQQNSQKLLRQLEVVSSSAEVCQNDPDGRGLTPYKDHAAGWGQVAAFVPSKVPRWRKPPFLNILIPEHHITPHMIKVNVMAKLNTVPDSALNEIEEFLDNWTFKWQSEEKWKLTLEEFLTLKVKNMIFDSKCCFSGYCDFYHNSDIFALNVLILSFRNFCEIVLFCVVLEFWLSGEMGQHAHHI